MTKLQLAHLLTESEISVIDPGFTNGGWTREQWIRSFMRQSKTDLEARWTLRVENAMDRYTSPKPAHPIQIRWASRVLELAGLI